MSWPFSFARFLAVLTKEFIQMRRDKVTFVMMIGVPIMQLLIFGYAINSDPRHLPTLVEMADEGPISRAILASMDTSTYFDFEGIVTSPEEGERALRDGTTSFVVVIPDGFERDVVRGLRPQILLAADASDPAAAGGAVAALSGIVDTVLSQTMTGALGYTAPAPPPFGVVVHKFYNPEGKTSVNIVPGLLAVILSLTMVMITAVAIVREREKGTMETLIATPVRPFEVMTGKIMPYVLVGYVQTGVFLVVSRILFGVPFIGSPFAFFVGFNLYIVVNLALGFLISTVAKSQMQAMQVSFFTLLPTILLSGFMFPFAAMPNWAQTIGSVIPATHFLRLIRKVMLKGADLIDIAGDLTAITLIMLVIVGVALKRYRQTLD
ncbi:ABC transporter permease [Marivivens sp. LCG002]|uniref:ABC transporter permease n=1 Tax=Marivivens sp. LCG002 TaxID=3051171 RepID=UPI002554A550|nr:ABC transporter permease [Marivivens sp. LCG002]WIV49733.1 ABC transporter permease [Marivivens sp. LCG002]